jgi:pimeloyl-ACP methyl ester carboxylesterase
MLTEKTFDTGAVSINYAEGPSSGIPLILLHAATTWWQSFLPVLPGLLIRYHTYALDLRGHGRSSWAPGAYTIRHNAEDVIRFLRKEVREPTILLGHSLGAMVALVAAAEAPEWVRAVVLEDPPLTEIIGTEISALSAALNKRISALRAVITMAGSPAEKRAALAAILPANVDAASLRRRFKHLSQCDPEELTFFIERRKFAPYRLETLLPRIACPVLLLQGNPALGGAIEDQDAALASSLLADCTHVYLRDVGHGIHAEQPATFLRIVSDFLEAL